MSIYFKSADMLLPENAPMESWAVIACDQFTSDQAYWDRVRANAGDRPFPPCLAFHPPSFT